MFIPKFCNNSKMLLSSSWTIFIIAQEHILKSGIISPISKSSSPLLGYQDPPPPFLKIPHPPSPTLPENWSFQVFLINRNATVKSQSQEITQSGKGLGRKAPVLFNLRKHVEMHCNDPSWVHSKTRKQGQLQHRLHHS